MKTTYRLLPLLLAVSLAACGGDAADGGAADPAKAASDGNTSLGRVVAQATDKARTELTKGNFKLGVEGLPRAEISPDGRLLIEGVEVTTSDAQRAQVLAYRKQVEGIALAGMDVGVAGANLGARAAGEAIRGIFNGETQEIEKRINAEADQVKQRAQQICERLPALLASQQALAVALPDFAPYATMDQSDVDDCGK